VLVLHHQGEEAPELIQLLAEVGVEKGVVALPAAPQDVVDAAQPMGRLQASRTWVAAQANTSGSGLVAAPDM